MSDELAIPLKRRASGSAPVLAIAGVATGIWMVPQTAWIGWMLIISCSLLGLTLLLSMLPAAIRLSQTGIELPGIFSKRRIAWADIERIGMTQLHDNQMIALTYHASLANEKVRQQLNGADVVLGDYYELPLTQLAGELQSWHARYGRQQAPAR